MTALGDNLVAIITGGGIGAGIATIVTAAIQARSGKSESRAHAADMLAEASGTLSTHYVTEIARLVESTTAMRVAINDLSAMVDEVLDANADLDPVLIRQLRRVNQSAKAST